MLPKTASGRPEASKLFPLPSYLFRLTSYLTSSRGDQGITVPGTPLGDKEETAHPSC